MFGCFAAVATDIVGVIVHPEIGFVAHTISNLAAGRHAWIQDSGLCLFSIGMAAVGAALARLNLGGWQWRLGCFLLIAMAACIFAIAVYNEYGDNDSGGLVIHIYLVAAVGVLFALVALLTARSFRQFGRFWLYFNISAAAIWLIAAPVFFVVPTDWDGLYERFIGLILVGWLAAVSWLLIAHGRDARAEIHQ